MSATAYGYPTSGASSVRPHAVTTAGANSYTYDNNGNLLTGAGRTFTWNSENKPLTVVQGGTTTTFIYDGDGGRVKKVVGSTTTRYISRLYECDNTNCSRYIWAGDTRIATIASNGTVNYWHGDHLGSSSVITDSTGAKVEAITYYPYGGTRTDLPGTPVNVPYKYTGQELDASTGLNDYGARHYDPVIGRFISPDTIISNPSNPQDFNRYSYVQNNPVNYIDPTGHYTAQQVKNIPDVELTLTDWTNGGALERNDLFVLFFTQRLTSVQLNRLLPLYDQDSDTELDIDGIGIFVSPGGNRIADFRALVAATNPKPTPTPTPTPPPAPKPTPVPTPPPSALMPVVPPPAPLPLEDPLLSPGDLGGIGSALKAVAVSATKIASVAAKQALGNVKFPSTKELARRLGIGENEVHEIKNSINVDLKDLHGMKNPDIGLDKAGSIALRDRITGRTVQTDVPLATYGSKK